MSSAMWIDKGTKTKTKRYGKAELAPSVRQFLQDKGFDMPKILNITEVNMIEIDVMSEYVDGMDLQDYFGVEGLRDSSQPEIFYEAGKFFARLHNVKNSNGLSVASKDLHPKNMLVKRDRTITLADWGALYYTDFPEEHICRHIILNINYSPVKIKAFIEGYNTARRLVMREVLDKFIANCYDNYQDLYLNGDLIKRGPRSNKRLSMIDWSEFKNRRVIDIGCSDGMLAREARRRGADPVLGVDVSGFMRDHLVVDLAKCISYLEGLNIRYESWDIEDHTFGKDTYDIAFFCAVLGHIKGDREAFLRTISEAAPIVYFESNLGNNKEITESFLSKVFGSIRYLGDSGDPDRDVNNRYHLYRCERKG